MNVKLRCLDCPFRRDVSDPQKATDLAEAHEEGRPVHNVIVDPYDTPTLGQVVSDHAEHGYLVQSRDALSGFGDGQVGNTHSLIDWVLENWETPVSKLGGKHD